MQRTTLQLQTVTPCVGGVRTFPNSFVTGTTPLLRASPTTRRTTSRTPLSVRSEFADPPDVYNRIVAAGAEKAKLPFMKAMISSIVAGTYIALGGFLCLNVGLASPALIQTNPGVGKIVTGIFGLPFGLFLVTLTGVELFTGNTMILATAGYEGKASWGEVFANWMISFVGNFLGTTTLIYVLCQCGIVGLPTALPIAATKTSFSFMQAFVRGILANWMVCMAIWGATGASSLPGKVLGIFIPISSFVAMGFEHSVANMFLIPFGIIAGASVSFPEFVIKNLIPVTIGNTLGGCIVVAAFGSMMFGKLGQSEALAEAT
eukprot:g59.t1